MNKLPVISSVSEVFTGVTRHYFQLLFAVWPAVVILLGVAALVTLLVFYGVGPEGMAQIIRNDTGLEGGLTGSAGPSDKISSFLISAGIVLGALLVGAMGAVRWHRFVLLGEGGGTSGLAHFLRAEDGRYLWTTVKIWLITVAVVIAVWSVLQIFAVKGLGGLALIAVPLLFIGLIAGAVALLRMSLALPDAAVGRGGRIRFVFAQSSGNGGELLGFSILLSILSMIPALVFQGMGVALQSWFHHQGIEEHWLFLVLGTTASVGVSLYFAMLQVTMLSVAYREIIGLPDTVVSTANIQGGDS
ncbi:hypothetical protein [Parvibaculum sp. MBR-TMA-1.3b-4.2]|jgi:hypothetical protein